MASPLEPPSLPWRMGSLLVMGLVGTTFRVVLFGANKTEVHGLGGFLELLDERRNIEGRQRGLITCKLWNTTILRSYANIDTLQFQIISACTYVSRTSTTKRPPNSELIYFERTE